MFRKRFLFIFLALEILLQTSPAPLRALILGEADLSQMEIPPGNLAVARVNKADFDGNGTLETFTLMEGRLYISSNGETLWQSPEGWNIRQAAISDLNRDGIPEITLLLWRPFHPWPVDHWLPNGGRISEFHNSEGQSCHIILIGWRFGGIHELWAGSAMADPITSFAVADLNGDKFQELIALESSYADPISAAAHTLKVWEWNGFGFTVVTSIDGAFANFTLVQTKKNGHILILVP